MLDELKTGELKDLKFLADRSGFDDVDNEQLRVIISDEYRMVLTYLLTHLFPDFIHSY